MFDVHVLVIFIYPTKNKKVTIDVVFLLFGTYKLWTALPIKIIQFRNVSGNRRTELEL